MTEVSPQAQREAEGLPTDVIASLVELRLISSDEEIIVAEPLLGGVSSQIWRVTTAGGDVCVKRALARLQVSAVWEAPVARNRYERLWYEIANGVRPGIAPKVLADDEKRNLFVMEYLSPADHRLWKSQLSKGRVDVGFAYSVGEAFGAIHRATAGRQDIALAFDTTELFERLRLEPYLRHTGLAHKDLAAKLNAMADRLAASRIGLVHGDASPKNIMIGPRGPVILDAECAWYGDPAFDPAFCLNHLLLKSVWRPEAHRSLQESARALWRGYSASVDWEPVLDLETRVARLVGSLLLARIDGKSPVEYIQAEDDKARVRRIARGMILDEVDRLEGVFERWNCEFGQ